METKTYNWKRVNALCAERERKRQLLDQQVKEDISKLLDPRKSESVQEIKQKSE